SSVQDLGRPGHRASGVSPGGALDPHGLRVANLLVGNEPGCAGLELTRGTVRLRFSEPRIVAWCGGSLDVHAGKCVVSPGRSALLRAGEILHFVAGPESGRAWLAISGGIDVPLVLGSRSTDLRSGFGGHEGRALRDGDALPLGQLSAWARALMKKLEPSTIASWVAPNEWSNASLRHPFLRILPGADRSRFSNAALDALARETFTVGAECDRMGVRLAGPELSRRRKGDLLSEAVAPGTIQVPPNGQPIVLLGDCQTIGGYPKIAHVIAVDLPLAAQLRPGDQIRFAETTLVEAQRLVRQRERDFEMFRIGLELHTPWS
ncbi:MAG: biotin-dependent carboxyltransferase family protein, partial [Verrucomicrobiota bacterium]|nr:biotin-dependent carboxyltransferase family protein [Verrucomicrobiota bacterium]